MAVPNLQQVAQGGTINATDVNQLVQAFLGTYLVNGPFVQVATQQVTANTASVLFSNIPQYNNLFFVWSGAGSSNASATVGLNLNFNGDSSANYYTQILKGTASTVSTAAATGLTAAVISDIAGSSPTTRQSSAGFCFIGNWANPANNLALVAMSGLFLNTSSTGMDVELLFGEYNVTGTPRTSLTVSASAGNLLGSSTIPATFTIYGSM